jgi:hypothetical protein
VKRINKPKKTEMNGHVQIVESLVVYALWEIFCEVW